MPKVIDFQQVSVIYPNGKQALREVSFSISAGECLALVGESGCGKSTLARVALGILPPKTKISGSIKIGEVEIIGSSKESLRKQRGLIVGFVPQNPFSAYNPLASVGDFVSEAWRVHSLFPPKNTIENSLDKLGIADVNARIKQLPHEWSGGMLQRAGIAAASAHLPKLIIADEPTSSLDSELNQVVLESLKKTDSAILLISHDLRLVEKYADKIAVMKGGEIVEINDVTEIFQNPQHQYTKHLLAFCYPHQQKKSTVSAEAKTVLEAKSLGHFYGKNQIIENVNFQIKSGEIIGICGASGCGKSTLLRLLATIETPKSGEVFLGEELATNGEATKLL
ncbi:MAG: ATP-binding cassette domain-containing protein, partial [Pyrinomonadaceae bacterium]|nr:ATP-binding cassette domain-containing protein [Pyrinomonadaceae bacterium]